MTEKMFYEELGKRVDAGHVITGAYEIRHELKRRGGWWFAYGKGWAMPSDKVAKRLKCKRGQDDSGRLHWVYEGTEEQTEIYNEMVEEPPLAFDDEEES